MATITLQSRQLGRIVVVCLGALVFLSAAWLNPFVASLIGGPRAIDFKDVLQSYVWFAVPLGTALVWAGWQIGRGPGFADSAVILIILFGSVVLCDRYLLTRYGLPLWAYDSEIRYKHRANAVRTLEVAGRPKEIVRINQWGFHDDEFPLAKQEGEFRALAVGDSVTMGYGLTYREVFSSHLEGLLKNGDRKFTHHQVINAGVHGYSTFQEKRVLERSLKFKPDIVFVGFCMNDVTEPFVVDTEYGGVGLDYHGVTQTPNPFVGWLVNETGFGRLVQTFSMKEKTLDAEKRAEVYNVRSMAENSTSSPAMVEAWQITLKQMGELYATAKANNIPAVLVIFPFSFQIFDDQTRMPQSILIEHARSHGVPVIDTTEDFAKAVLTEPDIVNFLKASGKRPSDIEKYYAHRTREFFIDEDHFTEAGHRIVAERLYQYLMTSGMVTSPTAAR